MTSDPLRPKNHWDQVRKAVGDALHFDCTLIRRPEGGWYVASIPECNINDSRTRLVDSLDDVFGAAKSIDRVRTGSW